jgi:hypothetical protein
VLRDNCGSIFNFFHISEREEREKEHKETKKLAFSANDAELRVYFIPL